LNIRWLKHEYKKDFAMNKLPPEHMPIVYGLVQIVTLKKKDRAENAKLTNNFRSTDDCFICKSRINADENILNKYLNGLKCLKCEVIVHTICLANIFKLSEQSFGQKSPMEQLLPLHGNCPKCETHLMWGDLIKYRLSLYKSHAITSLDENELVEADDDEEFVERDEDSD